MSQMEVVLSPYRHDERSRTHALEIVEWQAALRYSRLIPKHIRGPLFADLLRAGVIETDGKWWFYQDGRKGKSLAYRIGEAHRQSRIRPVHVNHRELLRKLNTARQRRKW